MALAGRRKARIAASLLQVVGNSMLLLCCCGMLSCWMVVGAVAHPHMVAVGHVVASVVM